MFVVRPFESKTISWWFAQRKNIDLEPPYQRRSGIWKAREKSYLIDSIVNGYDIPKFYIADFSYANTVLNVNKKQYAVIDGKQRFQAIFDFVEDNVGLASDFVYEKDEGVALAGLKYSQIKTIFPDICADIDTFNLNVMSVITDEKQKIDSLFVRLNKGKALTGAEIRSAMRGAVPVEIQRVADHEFFKKMIEFSTLRKQDENVAAKLLLIESNNGFADTKKVDLDRLVEEYVLTESSNIQVYSNRVMETLDILLERFVEIDFSFNSSGLIPVYYWLVRNKNDIDPKFFNWFTEKRKIGSEKDIVEFNQIVRSINDKETLERCYTIMTNEIEKFRNLTSRST